MGSCATGSPVQKNRVDHQQLPEDTDKFDPASKQMFEFSGSLTNVKIENISKQCQSKFSVCFKIPQTIDIVCPLQSKQQQKIKWNINTSFTFNSNDFELRTKFLSIRVNNQKNEEVSFLKINLYKIIVGPYHHDFKIGKKSKNYGRLIFDIHLVQKFLLNISSTSTVIALMKEYPGEDFFYQIQSQTPSSEKSVKAKKIFSSYVQSIPLQSQDQFRPSTSVDQAPSPTTRIKSKGEKLVRVNSVSEIEWSTKKNKNLPAFKMSIKANEINSTSFVFRLFRLSNEQKKSQFGFCSLLISDLFHGQENSQKQNQIVKRKLQKKLYHNGKNVGSVKLNFNVVNYKLMKQIYSRSRTEDGIINMHHFETYFSQESTKTQSDQVSKLYIKLSKIINRQEQRMTRINKFRDLEECIKQLLQAIQNSRKASLMYYSGNSKSKMQTKQKQSINILNLLYEILVENDGDERIRELSWKICNEIMKRGEFMIRNWGFYENEQQTQKNPKSSDKIFHERATIAEQYCLILFSLLKLALQNDTSVRGEKQQPEIFKANCYFRVPIFREKVLLAFSVNFEGMPEEILAERQYSQNNLKGCSQTDWEQFFFKPLMHRPNIKLAIGSLEKFLEDSKWLEQIAEKKGLFYDYIRYLMTKIVTIRQQHKIQGWRCFLGYDICVAEAIKQLKSFDLCKWSYQLILMGISLVENQFLLPQVLQIIYSKTNLHNFTDVRQMIGILTQIFYHISTRKSCLNSLDFPYAYFSQGIKLILEQSPNHLSLRLTLIFLFKFYDQFSIHYRNELARYLTGKIFWKFFYYWSYDVRDVFHHLIVLKIFQDHDLMMLEEIAKRASIIIRIIQNSLYLSSQKQRIQEVPMYIRMQEKLKKKKKPNKVKRFLTLSSQNTPIYHLNFDELIRPQINSRQKIEVPFYPKDQSLQLTKKTLSSYDNYNVRQQFLSKDEDNTVRSDSSYSLKIKRTISCSSHNQSHIQYGFLSSELFLPVLEERQLKQIRPYFEVSVLRFKELIELIDGYYSEHNQLPKMQDKLQLLGVKIDQKDILPEELHFQFFD